MVVPFFNQGLFAELDRKNGNLVGAFPEETLEMVQESTLQGSAMGDESMEREVLNQLSLFLIEKEWPHHMRYENYKEAWDLQMCN